jgi:hypothetical protein
MYERSKLYLETITSFMLIMINAIGTILFLFFWIRIVKLSLKNQNARANCSSNTDSRIHSGGINHKIFSAYVLACLANR